MSKSRLDTSSEYSGSSDMRGAGAGPLGGDERTNKYSEPSFARSVGLVTRREITMRLRSKVFLISTGILLAAVMVSVILGGILSQQNSAPKVAVVGSAAAVVHGNPSITAVPADTVADAEQLVRSEDVSAALIPAVQSANNPLGVTAIGLNGPPTDVLQTLAITPPYQVLNPDAPNPGIVYLVALGFGLIFFMSAITFGSTIAQSVVEEKQTRVVELLLSTISARALLTGKILGNSVLAFGQVAATAVIAITGLAVTGQSLLIGGVGPSIISFVIFFTVGFVMLASLFAGAAALVSRAEDVGSVTSPVTLLVMIPYLMVIFFNNNPTVLAIMSYIPFSAPVGMPMRVFLGTAAWWEPPLSLIILLATTVAVILISERVYSNSLLRVGARVKLREALSG